MAFKNMNDSFDEITVKRINIIDEKGVNRLVIANQERMPLPVINGKTYKSAVSPAGMIFYDSNGDECGGIVLSDLGKSALKAVAFDYRNADAVGLLAQDDHEGKNFKAGMIINDKDISGMPGNSIGRIQLMTNNGTAGLIINGPDEKPRIIITVDSLGKPVIQILDAKGKAIKSL